MENLSNLCPVSVVQNTLMGKWKLTILWILHTKTRRFNELQRLLPDISHGVLTNQLRELERDNLIIRKAYDEVPPKVEYSLTAIGESFVPVMLSIMEWGATYVSEVHRCDMGICTANHFPCEKCHDTISLKPKE